MRKFTLLLCLLSTTFVGKGQNLVPNGDFELYSGCPNGFTQIDSALFWMNPSLAGSPDYFHQCSNPSTVGVPNNYYGFQQGHSGNAYSGIILWSIVSNAREFIETPLMFSLIVNQCYHLEMYVSLANSSPFTTDDIGIYFSDTAITGINNYNPLPFTAQINNLTGNIFDTLNWTLVSGNYTAVGGENYLIIGNFKDDSITTTISATGTFPWIFVYIDDVSLSTCTGIEEHNQQNQITIYPNPAGDELFVNGYSLLGKKEIKIYDMMGKEVLKSAINLLRKESFGQSSTFNIKSLQSGIYFIEINGVRKKFVKE